MKTHLLTKAAAVALTAALAFSALVCAVPAQAAETELPSRYDARDYGYITSVKNQGSYGTCWAHGTLAACEASLIKNNGFSNDVDLSEYHLAYAATHKMYDKLGLFDSVVDINYAAQFMNDGKDLNSAAVTLACWNGAVLDSAHGGQFSSDKFEYQGLDQVDFASKELLYCMNAVRLTDYCRIPYAELDRIKEHILRYGAGAVAFPTQALDSERGVWLATDELPPAESAHAVAVVGWDDTIPADELTVSGYTPKEDGAFIIKNSWGEGVGTDGYYYVPYETVRNTDDYAYFYAFDADDTYTYSYGYDDLQTISYDKDADSFNSFTAANAYTATDDTEELRAVSFFPLGNEKSFEFKIYTDLPENAASPEEGTLSAVVTGGACEEGFRTVPLSEPIRLHAGERFAVSLTVRTENEQARIAVSRPRYTVPHGVAPTGTDEGVGSYLVVTDLTPKRGETYFYTVAGGWQDALDLQGYNARIKALTHSDTPQIAEPDDYEAYGGKTRAELIDEFQALNARWDEMFDTRWCYNEASLMHVENYLVISATIVEHPNVFTASELYATLAHYRDTLDNPGVADPLDLLLYFKEQGERYLFNVNENAPKDLPAVLEYIEEYEHVRELAENRAINTENHYAVAQVLLDKLAAILAYTTAYSEDFQLHFGDLDHNGLIDVNDATELQKVLAEAREEDFYSLHCSDVNQDGRKDISDVTCIQKVIAEVIDHFPVYDDTFGIQDEFTADTDHETAEAYLREAVEARRAQREDYQLRPDSGFDSYQRYLYFRMADQALQNADSLSAAELLYVARHLLATVPLFTPMPE